MSVSEAHRWYREFARMAQGSSPKEDRDSLEDYRGSDDAVGSCRKFARRFTEGIGKLAGNAKGDHRKEDQRTYRKIARACQSMWELCLN
ncbi:hypothetical protein B296_00039473 [Ensete ventricosum]|uniref:Uncharacterized protein n=1 Tax=Ensete ventricosum TaxID=4639 RepID=A0A426XLJ2_ENSVE|nr:hypothetical protein B296_00039473 [Ensete ventricosum]